MSNIFINSTQAKILLIALRAAKESGSSVYVSSACGRIALEELISKTEAVCKKFAKVQPKVSP